MYFAINNKLCIAVHPKVASMSISVALQSFNAPQITAQEAATFNRCVMFLRDPLERLNSCFSHFYWIEAAHSQNGFMPKGIIRAYGNHLRGGKINPHRFHTIEDDFNAAVESQKAGRTITDEELATEFDNLDYQAFVDYILAGNHDDHWGQQTALAKLNGQLIPNEIIKFEEIGNWWDLAVKKGRKINTSMDGEISLPKINSHYHVAHDDYRLSDLQAYYADDIALRGTL